MHKLCKATVLKVHLLISQSFMDHQGPVSLTAAAVVHLLTEAYSVQTLHLCNRAAYGAERFAVVDLSHLTSVCADLYKELLQ